MKSKQQGEKETTMSPFHDSIVLENLAIVKVNVITIIKNLGLKNPHKLILRGD